MVKLQGMGCEVKDVKVEELEDGACCLISSERRDEQRG